MKKKIMSIIMAAVMATSSAAAMIGCSPRDEVLKIYNWGDYIDESLIEEFEAWYQEKTGSAISVQYDTFETTEDIITRIEVLKSDYDLVCPSDYIAERMIKTGLAQKVDKKIFDVTDDFLYDGLAEMVKPFDPQNDYYVPYVWGTFGIMYDTNHIQAGSEDMKSWSAMWSQKYKKHILMKDSVRDAYSVAQIYENTAKLSDLSNGFTDYNAEYRTELISYFTNTSDSLIRTARDSLVKQKGMLYKYEVDDGKNDMLAGTTQAHLGLFWSCDTCLIMQEDGGDHFYYEVPKEGSNVWVDGWIIPKYAGNYKAANYFLKFINTYENDGEHDYAMTNFDYMGASMASKTVMEDARAALMEDEDGFFEDKEDWFKDMYIDMLFPSEQVLSRCGVMRDFGKKWSTELDSMWIDVKTL
ncbi:MAG: extracellular solute-binding protein [Clostridiales bacterium]|nr:extracellular solute-binding protein [Clostridiales bacterium]